MAKVTVTGFRELEQILKQLSAKGAKRVGRQALRRSGNDFLKEARNAAPVGEGRLKKAIRLRIDNLRNERSVLSALVYVSASASKSRPRKTQRQSRIKGKLGPARYTYQIGSRPDVYGIFQEFGAPAHGLPARPWFRPAWERKKNDVLQALLQELASGIARVAVETMGE